MSTSRESEIGGEEELPRGLLEQRMKIAAHDFDLIEQSQIIGGRSYVQTQSAIVDLGISIEFKRKFCRRPKSDAQAARLFWRFSHASKHRCYRRGHWLG
jgi:hypothetical protein